MNAPRDGIDAFALAMGVSREQAQRLLRHQNTSSLAFEELDATLHAEAALADLDAVEGLDAVDIEDAAAAAEPLGELKKIVSERSERSLRARLAAHASWAATDDPTARTTRGREAFEKRFEREVDPDGVLDPAERQRRVGHARKAYFLRLSLKSAQARGARRRSQS